VNPEINHQLGGWMSFVRKQVLYLLFYYMSFLMLDSMEKIRRFIKISILIALLVAFWGFKQQYLGFTAYEDGWIHSDPTITQLLFQGGMFRKFSLMSDPVAFGVLVTSMGLLTLVVALRERKKYRRNLYLFFTIILLVSSSYSGTRTCNVMLVSGLVAYIIFTINEKKSIRLLFSSLAIALFLLFGPFKNTPLIYRIRTTFEANKDASNLVRDVNRKRIQPYIYVHPIGGGLNTCGEEGKRFYPEHVLAGYPPDSGYMKIMLDQGWIGLAINIIFYFILLQRGITGFYESTKREIKTIYIALTICLFSLIVGQYSQECIRAYPQILFFYAALVIFYKLKQYDTISSETNETT
jgi:putative inorganic carbon (hco3(-)) transporter